MWLNASEYIGNERPPTRPMTARAATLSGSMNTIATDAPVASTCCAQDGLATLDTVGDHADRGLKDDRAEDGDPHEEGDPVDAHADPGGVDSAQAHKCSNPDAVSESADHTERCGTPHLADRQTSGN